MRIVTNWKPRQLYALADLPEKARDQFDYVDIEDYSPRFVKYRGQWVDAVDTQCIEPRADNAHPMGWAMRVHPGSPLALFDSIASDSYFSGLLFRFVDRGESVIVGWYTS